MTIGTPPLPVTGFVLRRMLGRGRAITLNYHGDRMHPAVRHGQMVEVRPVDGVPLPGAVVLALPDNIPDLLRVVETTPDGIVLAGDADPSSRFVLPPDAVLALTDPPAESVRRKYDEQAPFYGVDRPGPETTPLEARVRHAAPTGGRILVAGSGAGFECFRLEQIGFEVLGIDFSSRMVALARAQAAKRGSRVRFAEADLRSHEEPNGALDAGRSAIRTHAGSEWTERSSVPS